jgi:hypothetical protein
MLLAVAVMPVCELVAAVLDRGFLLAAEDAFVAVENMVSRRSSSVLLDWSEF